MMVTTGLMRLISFRYPSRKSLNSVSRFWSSSRIAPGDSARLSAASEGWLERLIPVISSYLTMASVINWLLEVEDVEDVACSVDDIEATDRSKSLGWRG